MIWALTTDGLERSSDTGLSWELVSRFDGVDDQPVALVVSSDHVWLVTEQHASCIKARTAERPGSGRWALDPLSSRVHRDGAPLLGWMRIG